MKMYGVQVFFLFCLSHHLVWTAPVLEGGDYGRTLEVAVQVVGRSSSQLARDINIMLQQSANTGLRTADMRSMCEGLQSQCKNVVGQMEALQQVAAHEGKILRLQNNPGVIKKCLKQMLSEIELSPFAIIQIIFRTNGPLSMDNARQSVLMSALNQLGNVAAKEGRFVLNQAPYVGDLQEWLDKLLVIARTVAMVTDGVIDNIDDAETIQTLDSTLFPVPAKPDVKTGYDVIPAEEEPQIRARRQTNSRLDLGSLFGSANERQEFLDDLSSTLRGMIPTLEMGGFNMDQEGLRYRGRHIHLDISFDPLDQS